MGSIIFIDVLTHIPKNNMNNHPVVLINTITWFSLSKVLRSWKLHVGRSMAYKTIDAYLACSKLGPTKNQKCSKLAPIVWALTPKRALTVSCLYGQRFPLKFYLCSHKLMINFVTVAVYIHMTFARIANWWQKSDNYCDCCSH
jgi:hypothetical protein